MTNSNSVILQQPDRALHNMSEEVKTTTSLGRLTPVYFAEVVPGDIVDLNAEFLTKFQPMRTPAFQNFNAHIHYFYVPFRVLWPRWKWFIQNQKKTGELAPPIHPFFKPAATLANRYNTGPLWLAQYFGFYTNADVTLSPFAWSAYQMIYNEYYRHEQMTPDRYDDCVLTDGDNTPNFDFFNSLRYRTYKDDYFAMALLSPQLGEAAALSLLSDEMMPVYSSVDPIGTDVNQEILMTNQPSGFNGTNIIPIDTSTGTPYNLFVNPNDGQLNITVNELIQLQRMQEFLVRQNIAGNRYNEYILAFFGIRVPDLRLDRPDYICGIKAPVAISEVVNMGSDTDQGYQTGQGNSYAEGGRGRYEVLEHGIIMGLYSCIPNHGYMNATKKMFHKNNWESYYVPAFDQMGEMPILNKELVLNHIDPEGTWGYVPQFADYRESFNFVTGEFRTTLTTWHLNRALPNNINLSEAFFNIYNPDRVFDIDLSTDSILLWVVNQVSMLRKMKLYSMPTLTNNYGNNLV